MVYNLSTTDLNTKFFHISTTMRRRRNSIESLKISPNQWIYDTNGIQNSFLDHFKNICTSTEPTFSFELDDILSQKLSEVDNLFLYEILNEQEILVTLRKIPYSNAPGPDGFIGLLYKHF